MKDNYDFSKGKRGALVQKTIKITCDVCEGTGYHAAQQIGEIQTIGVLPCSHCNSLGYKLVPKELYEKNSPSVPE